MRSLGVTICPLQSVWFSVSSPVRVLTRHRLGCFCTHHSLEGGRIRPPPVLSRKRMDVERRTRRHSKDLDETLPNHFLKFKTEVTCQVKVRSKVKIGCFQVADRSDLKRGIFRPKLSICTPKYQAKVLTSEILSYLAQIKVKVRSEKVTKPKNFKWVVWHMFYGPFWTKNSIVTVILQFDWIWTKKMRESIQGQVKKVKRVKFS